MRVLAVISVVLAMVAAASFSRLHLEEAPGSDLAEKELLYLPNGRYLKIVSLGQASLVADVVYLWAIQFYSDYGREDRYAYLQHIFGEVIPELDPLYVDPYWLGAMILSVEVRDVDGALELLETGMENNPDAWILPYLAGWEAEGAGRPLEAAEYFERAAAIPDAPSFARRMGAGMLVRAGRFDDALRSWQEVLEDPASDEISRVIAERWIRILETRRTVRLLETAVRAYRERRGRPPRSLDDLVTEGLISSVPVDPNGARYAYDPRTGRVSSPAGRILGVD
jgi:tetratricopeptide (TPR) repeat protein